MFSFSSVKSQDKKDAFYDSIQKYLYEDPNKAIEVANKMITNETDPDKKIKYYLYLSKAYTAKRNPDESLKVLLKAQELLKTTVDVQSKIDVLITIAIQYQQMELYQKSFATLDEVDKLCQQLTPEFSDQKNSWLGKTFAIKGIIYKSQKNNDIALQKFLSAINYFQKAEQNIPTVNNISIVYYNIGYCYLNLDQIQNSEKYFQKAIEYAKKSKAQSLEAYALKGLAESYGQQNNRDKAIEFLEIAKNKADKIDDLSLDEGIYKALSENYLSRGQFGLYLKNNEIYKKVQFEKQQSELKSINTLINNIGDQQKVQLEKAGKESWMTKIILIVISILLSAFVLIRTIKINSQNKIYKKKIRELIAK
jgi:tetratricopeptide (TPR) repeat protein